MLASCGMHLALLASLAIFQPTGAMPSLLTIKLVEEQPPAVPVTLPQPSPPPHKSAPVRRRSPIVRTPIQRPPETVVHPIEAQAPSVPEPLPSPALPAEAPAQIEKQEEPPRAQERGNGGLPIASGNSGIAAGSGSTGRGQISLITEGGNGGGTGSGAGGASGTGGNGTGVGVRGSGGGSGSEPGGTGSGLVAGRSGGSTGNADVLQSIRRQIERAKFYPDSARRQGLEGIVELRFRVAPDGSVAAVEIVRSSGHVLLDESSSQTVRRAAPYPVVGGWIRVPLSYRLNQ